MHAVGHSALLGHVLVREVGELIVENESVEHEPRAEPRLDRCGHAERIAVGIDDGEMRRGGQFRAAGRYVLRALHRNISRRRLRHALVGGHKGRALFDVIGRDQSRGRYRHLVRVGEIDSTVGESETPRFDQQMLGRGRVGAETFQVELLEDAESLNDAHAA